ncbi:MAG: SMC family ATPase [Cyanobacteria bacterium P01_C01_bin.69]
MQILSVALTNFKTHKEQTFHFELGTNAICGENGAGKTSILEAIAWALFNYQGNYRKEDLIRNGASSAQVIVTFISSRDSRTYEVQRSTTSNYTIHDPQLAENLPFTRTKDEVLPWLRQHIGVAPGTDLGQLFANTIGVPQGTFTADFLLSPEKRKPIFDTILKVEEYRETFKQSLSLSKYAEAQSQRLKDLIEQYEESLQSWDELQNRSQQLHLEITQGEGQLARLEQQRKEIAQRRQSLVEQAENVQKAQNQQQTLSTQLVAQQQSASRAEVALQQAQQAVKVCTAQREAYDRFLVAEVQLKALGEQQQQRQSVLKQQQKQQQSLAKSQADLSRLEAKLEQFESAEKSLNELGAQVTTQLQLEGQRTDLSRQVQAFATVRLQQQNLGQQGQRLEQEIRQVEGELKRLAGLKGIGDRITEWEQQQARIQEQLSRMAAAQQFEQELQALSTSGQARQDGYREQVVAALATLESWVARFDGLQVEEIAPIKDALFQGGILSKETLAMINGILADLAEQTDPQKLQKQRQTIQKQLKQAYAQNAQLEGLPAQEKKRSQLTTQQQTLQQQLSNIEKQLTTEAETTQAFAALEEQLRRLDNPRGKQQLLEKTLQQQGKVQSQYKALEATRVAGVQQIEAIATQLKAFEQLDANVQKQQQHKQENQAAYLLYLQNQQVAGQAETLAVEHKQAVATLTKTQKQKADLDKKLIDLLANFDPEAFAVVDKQYTDTKSQEDRLRGSLPQLQQRFADLTAQIKGLEATAKKRDEAQVELKQRDRIKRFIKYARTVYKAAGPRITERYVQNISREADRLFRELLGRANVALSWSADYEITVQEGAHNRRFLNLSGGEQMCAALAVRLALLKVLADIDVAFFDEPTTNMDRPRRAGLAEAIARIKSFNQLFVISHDDTFEQVTETVITVEREG